MELNKYRKINSADNVAVAIIPLKSGEKVFVDDITIMVTQDIPAGHSFALANLFTGDSVIKSGIEIAQAISTIFIGDLVNEKNTQV